MEGNDGFAKDWQYLLDNHPVMRLQPRTTSESVFEVYFLFKKIYKYFLRKNYNKLLFDLTTQYSVWLMFNQSEKV